MKILVTGGAGYIGSHVVHELCDQGHKVNILDNLSLGREENIDPRAQMMVGDVRDEDDLSKALSGGIDVVYHFAAWKAVGESMVIPEKYAENNIWGTLQLLTAMIKYNVMNFVFSSSAAVYGNPQYLPIDEKHPKNPTNYYGYSKLAIEENLHWFSRLKGVNYAALRYFNATGYDVKGRIKGKEKKTGNLSPIVMEAACGMRGEMQVFGDDYDTPDGTCIRDYIHVNDLASAHLMAMDYIIGENKNLIVNLGTGRGSSVLEVIYAAEKILNQKIPYKITGRREGDPDNLVAGIGLAHKLLKWEARYSDLQTILSSMKPLYFE